MIGRLDMGGIGVGGFEYVLTNVDGHEGNRSNSIGASRGQFLGETPRILLPLNRQNANRATWPQPCEFPSSNEVVK